jgi:hypothetical protein
MEGPEEFKKGGLRSMATRMGAREQDERDLMMMLEFAIGRKEAEIAHRHHVDERTVRRALRRVEAKRHSLPREEPDAIEELEDYVLRLDQMSNDLGELRTRSTRLGDRIRAMRLQLGVWGERLRILTLLGVLPNEPMARALRHTMVGELAQRFRRELKPEDGWSEDDVNAVLDVLERWWQGHRFAPRPDTSTAEPVQDPLC